MKALTDSVSKAEAGSVRWDADLIHPSEAHQVIAGLRAEIAAARARAREHLAYIRDGIDSFEAQQRAPAQSNEVYRRLSDEIEPLRHMIDDVASQMVKAKSDEAIRWIVPRDDPRVIAFLANTERR